MNIKDLDGKVIRVIAGAAFRAVFIDFPDKVLENIKNPKPELWIVVVIVLTVLGLGWAVLFPIEETLQLNLHVISQSEYDSKAKLYSRIAEGLGAILPSLGGLALSGTAFAAIRNLRVAEDTRRIAEEKQVTDLFVKAVEMLGDKERIEVRIGGIYTFERIARTSDKDCWIVMEVLTAFIRKEAIGVSLLKAAGIAAPYRKRNDELWDDELWGDKLELASSDIEAALRVIGRREGKDPRKGFINLTNANVSGVELENKANFQDAIFSGAYCIRAVLPQGIFKSARFPYADLRRSQLYKTDFTDADFGGADLRGANIQGAVLAQTDLENADLRNVEGRKAAQIVAAKNWWLAKYDDEFAKELTEFAQQQAEHDPEFVEQLRLFEQHRQAQSEEPDDPSDTSG